MLPPEHLRSVRRRNAIRAVILGLVALVLLPIGIIEHATAPAAIGGVALGALLANFRVEG